MKFDNKYDISLAELWNVVSGNSPIYMRKLLLGNYERFNTDAKFLKDFFFELLDKNIIDDRFFAGLTLCGDDAETFYKRVTQNDKTLFYSINQRIAVTGKKDRVVTSGAKEWHLKSLSEGKGPIKILMDDDYYHKLRNSYYKATKQRSEELVAHIR